MYFDEVTPCACCFNAVVGATCSIYALTDAGRSELAAWLSDILRTPKKEYLNFEAGLTLMLHLSAQTVAKILTERIEHLVSVLDDMKTQLQVLTERFQLAWVLTIEREYAIALLEAERTFVRSIVADLQSGELDWDFPLETPVTE